MYAGWWEKLLVLFPSLIVFSHLHVFTGYYIITIIATKIINQIMNTFYKKLEGIMAVKFSPSSSMDMRPVTPIGLNILEFNTHTMTIDGSY